MVKPRDDNDNITKK
ncbi:MAG: hypothetical protein ACEY3D_08425 [Rickettsia sp.]